MRIQIHGGFLASASNANQHTGDRTGNHMKPATEMSDRELDSTRHVCNWCGKKVKTYVPRGGDGSAELVRKHKDSSGDMCRGSYHFIDRMKR